MVGEYEDRYVIDRIFSPPALPTFVEPRSAYGSEHISAQNPGADVSKASRCEVVVNPSFPAVVAEQCLLKDTSPEGPGVKGSATCSEWMLQALIGAGGIPIERDREALDAQQCHGEFLRGGWGGGPLDGRVGPRRDLAGTLLHLLRFDQLSGS